MPRYALHCYTMLRTVMVCYPTLYLDNYINRNRNEGFLCRYLIHYQWKERVGVWVRTYVHVCEVMWSEMDEAAKAKKSMTCFIWMYEYVWLLHSCVSYWIIQCYAEWRKDVSFSSLEAVILMHACTYSYPCSFNVEVCLTSRISSWFFLYRTVIINPCVTPLHRHITLHHKSYHMASHMSHIITYNITWPITCHIMSQRHYLPGNPTIFPAFSISCSLLASVTVVVHFCDVDDTVTTFSCTISTRNLK